MFWKIGQKVWDLTHKSYVMGILNVTPDSFSDGGCFMQEEQAVAHARQLVDEGALFLDVGGESSRPGAEPVSLEEEKRRVLPVVARLKSEFPRLLLSVDTVKPAVAVAALELGADIINDINGFQDPEMVKVVSASDCGLIVMHKKGEPKTMQEAPHYENVVAEVRAFFEAQYRQLTQEAGIEASRLCFDPGLGFGKSSEHNLALLQGLSALKIGDCALMMALSRKRFLGVLLENASKGREAWVSAQASVFAHRQGARVHRLHDVLEGVQALEWEAILERELREEGF